MDRLYLLAAFVNAPNRFFVIENPLDLSDLADTNYPRINLTGKGHLRRPNFVKNQIVL